MSLLAVTTPRSLAAIASALPALFLLHPKAAERFFEFFTVNIRNRNTRRALIATMIYTFARIGAVLQMNVGDYYTQGRRVDSAA